jgi:hypothetical protein
MIYIDYLKKEAFIAVISIAKSKILLSLLLHVCQQQMLCCFNFSEALNGSSLHRYGFNSAPFTAVIL